MRFENVAVPAGHLWSSPFVKWQGSLADMSSLDLAADVTSRALSERQIDTSAIAGLVLGWTVPQPDIFYGAPLLAAARHRRHHWAHGEPGMRDIGCLPRSSRRAGRLWRRGTARRRHRPDKQRPSGPLPTASSSGRCAAVDKLGPRQLLPRPVGHHLHARQRRHRRR